jgi:hypothetical protein
MDLKFMAHSDANDETEQKTNCAEHERQQQSAIGRLGDSYPQPLRDSIWVK